MPLPVSDSRGYTFAEATAGGVALTEIDAATMASRVCPGLFCVGEILDVDGRIGGFNFQWAWSSGFVAGPGLAADLTAALSGSYAQRDAPAFSLLGIQVVAAKFSKAASARSSAR